ncbi:hypothetical protein CDIK_2466 [Cucumispora dikerogammari]|nr:hypothetical protein CDIK_2466 [Cucumispora dikerogammari]
MFVYLRKIIVMDATFLSGPNKSTLITATLQNGNNSLIIMAFAIVESKNTNAYRWFFKLLNVNFEVNNENTILVSDRDLGLISATSSVLLNVRVCYCVRHIAKNLKLKFKNKVLINIFWKCVYN